MTNQAQPLLSFRSEHPFLFYTSAFFLVILLSLTAFAEYFKPIGKRKGKDGKVPNLPPGPPGLPIIGSLLDVKEGIEDPEYTKLKSLSQYGEMATLHLGAKTFVFLNSSRVAAEIINKRGSITNERSSYPVSSGIVSHGHRRSLLMHQASWAEPRRAMHSLLSGSHLKLYGAWQELESTQLLAEYLLKPKLWYRHHFRYANSVIHRIALGERLVKSSKELEDLQNVVTSFLSSVMTSTVDWFPGLERLLPWWFVQPWRLSWAWLDKWNYDVYRQWWDPAKEKIQNGTAPPSFARDVLLNPDTPYKGDDDDMMYVAMELVEAGSDTTRMALNVAFMAALEHPSAFRKAREEVDRVCGKDADARLPTLADLEDLKYICAMAKEVMRWRPIIAPPPDHTSTKDFDFDGYHFPAGTGFVLNLPALSEEVRDPESFVPERWLDGHETNITHGLWLFGGGRRICVGYRLAQNSLFLLLSRLVQSFDLKEAGPYNPRRLHFHTTSEPFPVDMTVRNKHYKNLILSEAERQGVLEDAKLEREKL
ncbi:cytochrome P450 [Copromyces sp. CBS 386.78]|nr:cytochrome P450 [Copromyces sp. CBS 386.78]